MLGLFVFYDLFPCPFPRLTTRLRSCAYYSQHLSDLAVLPVRTFFNRHWYPWAFHVSIPFLSGFSVTLLGYTVLGVCASPRNLTWFTRPFFLMRGWDLGTQLLKVLQHTGSREGLGMRLPLYICERL